MKNKLVNINLHGILGEQVGKTWNLAVKSISEAMHAIEVLSRKKLYKNLLNNDKNNIRYEVIVNGEKLQNIGTLDKNKIEEIKSSELCLSQSNLESIDIVPVICGADMDILTIVLGAILIVVGILIIVGTLGGGTALGIAIGIAGLGLIAAGVINLLSPPPEFEDFREIGGNRSLSYLFNGPENVVGEGGPVPVGYGRLIVGSQVISASYEVSNKPVEDGITI